jgi:hypothetical protein
MRAGNSVNRTLFVIFCFQEMVTGKFVSPPDAWKANARQIKQNCGRVVVFMWYVMCATLAPPNGQLSHSRRELP